MIETLADGVAGSVAGATLTVTAILLHRLVGVVKRRVRRLRRGKYDD